MKSGSVSFDKNSQVDSIERSSDKADKKSDKDMELIFDDFLSKKMNREEQAEMLRKEKLFETSQNRAKHALTLEHEKQFGLYRQDEKSYKDKTDSDSQLSPSVQVGYQTSSQSMTDVQGSPEAQDLVSKLEGMIQQMVSDNLSDSNMIVRVSGGGAATIDVALNRSQGQTEVLISSQSTQVLELISNQLNQLEQHMHQHGNQNVRVTVVS